MRGDPIAPVFFAALSGLFGCYGVRELARAYRLGSLEEWIEKAVSGTGGLLLSALFACCSYWRS
jgi:hypothetical protein